MVITSYYWYEKNKAREISAEVWTPNSKIMHLVSVYECMEFGGHDVIMHVLQKKKYYLRNWVIEVKRMIFSPITNILYFLNFNLLKQRKN